MQRYWNVYLPTLTLQMHRFDACFIIQHILCVSYVTIWTELEKFPIGLVSVWFELLVCIACKNQFVHWNIISLSFCSLKITKSFGIMLLHFFSASIKCNTTKQKRLLAVHIYKYLFLLYTISKTKKPLPFANEIMCHYIISMRLNTFRTCFNLLGRSFLDLNHRSISLSFVCILLCVCVWCLSFMLGIRVEHCSNHIDSVFLSKCGLILCILDAFFVVVA